MTRVIRGALRVGLLLVILGMVVAAGSLLVARKKAALNNAPVFDMGKTPVRVAEARTGVLVERLDYLAVVEPVRFARISARLTAAIEKLECDEGDHVSAGQVLARLDDRETRDEIAGVAAQRDQAEAELAASEAQVKSLEQSVVYWQREASRDKTLADKGDIPASAAEATADKAAEFEGRLEAQRQTSHAITHQTEALDRRKEQLETCLGYCELRSPYHGIITQRVVDPGDLATPGKTLFVVEDRSQLKLAFDVPQADLARVHEGLEVELSVAGKKRLESLTHMFPSLDAARTLRAEANLEEPQDEGLTCGAYVPISVVLEKTEGVTLIPATCVVELGPGDARVFVVEKGRLAARRINLLGPSGDDVAVGGVEAGELVVTSTFLGWARLANGLEVEAIR